MERIETVVSVTMATVYVAEQRNINISINVGSRNVEQAEYQRSTALK